MAYHVPYAFGVFFDNINLSGDHRSTASARKHRLVSLLGKTFEILSMPFRPDRFHDIQQ
jgi:hypothetical protein